MKIAIIFIFLLLFCVFISCKEKRNSEVIVETAVIVQDTIIKPEPIEEVKEEKPVRNQNQKYFLVAGCFEYKELADKLCEKLQGEGYDSKIIPYFENLYLVSYNGFATKAEANAALKELKNEKGKEKTWIYKSQN